MSDTQIIVAAARRTPIGAMLGSLTPAAATELGSAAIQACLNDAQHPPEEISEVLMGCVLPAGLGQAPARQAALAAGLLPGTPCATISKVCGSGLYSVMLAHDRILADPGMAVVAGGMESMSNAPYLVEKARGGLRMGHKQLRDHMFLDGLQNPYDGEMMGHFAEQTARRYGFHARRAGRIRDRIGAAGAKFGIRFRQRDHACYVRAPRQDGGSSAKMKSRRAATWSGFRPCVPLSAKDGTVTAASSSSISDGGAALLLMSAGRAAELGIEQLARVVVHASHAQAPEWFTTAPGPAIAKCLEKAGWKAGQVDLFEINEAFACVTMAAMRDLGLAPDRVNPRGGACALGHPHRRKRRPDSCDADSCAAGARRRPRRGRPLHRRRRGSSRCGRGGLRPVPPVDLQPGRKPGKQLNYIPA